MKIYVILLQPLMLNSMLKNYITINETKSIIICTFIIFKPNKQTKDSPIPKWKSTVNIQYLLCIYITS